VTMADGITVNGGALAAALVCLYVLLAWRHYQVTHRCPDCGYCPVWCACDADPRATRDRSAAPVSPGPAPLPPASVEAHAQEPSAHEPPASGGVPPLVPVLSGAPDLAPPAPRDRVSRRWTGLTHPGRPRALSPAGWAPPAPVGGHGRARAGIAPPPPRRAARPGPLSPPRAPLLRPAAGWRGSTPARRPR
jgi:hypothetical protein